MTVDDSSIATRLPALLFAGHTPTFHAVLAIVGNDRRKTAVAFNPNYVPWMSLLGIIGLGIGFAIGGGRTDPQGMIPPLYGLLIGSVVGVVVRMALRRRQR